MGEADSIEYPIYGVLDPVNGWWKREKHIHGRQIFPTREEAEELNDRLTGCIVVKIEPA